MLLLFVFKFSQYAVTTSKLSLFLTYSYCRAMKDLWCQNTGFSFTQENHLHIEENKEKSKKLKMLTYRVTWLNIYSAYTLSNLMNSYYIPQT